MKKVLVLCTGNSCRSQIAHGYLNYYTGNTQEIYSAGLKAHGVNPKAIKTMGEVGIDISSHTSNNVSECLSIEFDYILTVCDHANETCPIFHSDKATRIHQNFVDPTSATGSDEDIAEAFRIAREKISEFCKDFCKQYLGN